jgi:hypothetical protein
MGLAPGTRQCYLGSREPKKADSELQILLSLYPASRAVWRRWYEQQKLVGPPQADFRTTNEPWPEKTVR